MERKRISMEKPLVKYNSIFQNRARGELKKEMAIISMSVVKDGETLSNSQYYNLTTREMRSSKNPIVGYHHEDGFKPMWGPSDHPLRAKL